jgi:thiosulfate reductase cytochrome b subunit
MKLKKTSGKKLEELRMILDNPNDPNNKKSISKDKIILESIRSKLSSNKYDEKLNQPSKVTSIDIIGKEKPIADIIKKKEEEIQSKKIEPYEKYENKKIEQVKNDDFENEDIIEVEKTGVSKSKFLEIKPRDIEIEDKKVVFDELDENYWKKKIAESPSDKIQMYSIVSIFEMWIFTIILATLIITGLFLLRDWFFLNFGIYGEKFISTPEPTQNIHIWFGFALAVLGLLHLAIHIFSKKKDILPKQTLRDFKGFLHSIIYLLGFARREEYGSERFNGRQKIVYIALVYILGLTIITGLIIYFELFANEVALLHIIPAGLSGLVLLFQFFITIRKHDIIALNSAFISGKLPIWYIRKNHPIWYKKLKAERKETIKKLPQSMTAKSEKTSIEEKDEVSNAVYKFALLINNSPEIKDIETYVKNLQSNLEKNELQRIIELSKEIKDESKDNINRKVEQI